MTDNTKSTRDMTDEEIYVRDVQQQVNVVARKLEELAARLRQTGEGMKSPHPSSGAVGIAGDIVNEFMQGVGNIGSYLWGVVHEAQHLDRHRQQQAAEDGKVV